ncbi:MULTISPECIES: hypothetical protein [Empedobacter]|uniref:TonB-dependent receptor n=1 Tax=Empedobacter falsenii TaxID=343874 RepID=A0A427BQS4_9FLAO|nr:MULTISPECIES: hypothetical protein [Empedobacter]MDH0659140.1 hypothetical protein [Empedobacter sp. GD03865]RRT92901.1 hypothetical protein EGI89_04875 [Empedobacter falsenii]RRT93024.1 hypothetical protein EGI88_04825 [Empedobacter falsenii]
MKKLLLAFAFLPMLSFAQDANESPRKGIFDSSVIKESNDPAVFLDGQRVDKSVLSKMNPDDIKYITVIKTDKNQYPNGKIEIILKKQKES